VSDRRAAGTVGAKDSWSIHIYCFIKTKTKSSVLLHQV